jgi:hypothetical protein
VKPINKSIIAAAAVLLMSAAAQATTVTRKGTFGCLDLHDATNLSVGGDVKGFIALGRCIDIDVGTPVDVVQSTNGMTNYVCVKPAGKKGPTCVWLPFKQIQELDVTEDQQEKSDRIARRLTADYAAFAYVRVCHQSREGYLVQYVNDVEMAKARNAIEAIVAQAKKDDPAINTDEAWSNAMAAIRGMNLDQMGCHNTLTQLLKRSPIPVYSTEKP